MRVYKIENQYFAEEVINNETIIVSITSEVYYAYMRPIWAEEKRKERETRCRKAKGTRCMGNCSECKEYRSGTPLSLEQLADEFGFEPAYPVSVEGQVLRNELYQTLYNAIDSLDEMDKLIIELYFFEGKTERQIADLLDFGQKGVNTRKTKILGKMREILKGFI